MPVGGSNAVGFWGYLNAFQELLDQVRFTVNKTFSNGSSKLEK